MNTAIFGAGAFRRVQTIFGAIPGVTSVTPGYSGGDLESPTWEEVCSDTTGHALVVRLEFNDTVVSYEALLDIFWGCHDPTTINQQGVEIGSCFRSVIFSSDDAQFQAAMASRDRLQATGRYRRAIVTQISPAMEFWGAEPVVRREMPRESLQEGGNHLV